MNELLNILIDGQSKKAVPSKVKPKDSVSLRRAVTELASNGNALVPAERQVTTRDVETVAARSLTATAGMKRETRYFIAYRDVASYINLAIHGEVSENNLKNLDLLPVGHPLSTRKHVMTASAYSDAVARWIAADPRVDESAREIVAAAYKYPLGSVEQLHASASLSAMTAGLVPQDILIEVQTGIPSAITAAGNPFAGGNSSAARSARARGQLRDRLQQFAEEGGGLQFFLKRAGGGIRSIVGKFAGNSPDNKNYEIEVFDDPSIDDGLYSVPSNRVEAFSSMGAKALLPGEVVSKSLGKDVALPDGVEAEDAATITKLDAPSGWELVRTKEEGEEGPDRVYKTADGYLVDVFDANPENMTKVSEYIKSTAQPNYKNPTSYKGSGVAPDAVGTWYTPFNNKPVQVAAAAKGKWAKDKPFYFTYRDETDQTSKQWIGMQQSWSDVNDVLERDQDKFESAYNKLAQDKDTLAKQKVEQEKAAAESKKKSDARAAENEKIAAGIDENIKNGKDALGNDLPEGWTAVEEPYGLTPVNENLIDPAKAYRYEATRNGRKVTAKYDGDGNLNVDGETVDGWDGADQRAFDLGNEKKANDILAAKEAIAKYDEDGEIAKAIDSGAEPWEIEKMLDASPKYRSDYDKYISAKMADFPQKPEKEFMAEFDKMSEKIAALGSHDRMKAPFAGKKVMFSKGSRAEEIRKEIEELDRQDARDREIVKQGGFLPINGAAFMRQKRRAELYAELWKLEGDKIFPGMKIPNGTGVPNDGKVTPKPASKVKIGDYFSQGELLSAVFTRNGRIRFVYKLLTMGNDNGRIQVAELDPDQVVDTLPAPKEDVFPTLPNYSKDKSKPWPQNETDEDLLAQLYFLMTFTNEPGAPVLSPEGEEKRQEAIQKIFEEIKKRMAKDPDFKPSTENMPEGLNSFYQDTETGEFIDLPTYPKAIEGPVDLPMLEGGKGDGGGDGGDGDGPGSGEGEGPDFTNRLEELDSKAADMTQQEFFDAMFDGAKSVKIEDLPNGDTFTGDDMLDPFPEDADIFASSLDYLYGRDKDGKWFTYDSMGELMYLDGPAIGGEYEIAEDFLTREEDGPLFFADGYFVDEDLQGNWYRKGDDGGDGGGDGDGGDGDGGGPEEPTIEPTGEVEAAPVTPPAATQVTWDYPEGAYKVNTDEYDPEGRQDEESTNFTDDPKVLANRFDQSTLRDAFALAVRGIKDFASQFLEEMAEEIDAESDDEDAAPKKGKPGPKKKKPAKKIEGTGFGKLEFNMGDEFVPAEAIYHALVEQGVDADMLLAELYDLDTGETKNVDALNKARSGENVEAQTPSVILDDFDDYSDDPELAEMLQLASDMSRVRDVSVGVSQIERARVEGEPNQKITDLANEILDLTDNIDVQQLLAKYIGWGIAGTPEQEQAFRGLWGILTSADGGITSRDSWEGSLNGFQKGVESALLAYNGVSPSMEEVKAVFDRFGYYPELVKGKEDIGVGNVDLYDEDSLAGNMFRLIASLTEVNAKDMLRGTTAEVGSDKLAYYTTQGDIISLDPRSFSDDANVAIAFSGALGGNTDNASIVLKVPAGAGQFAKIDKISMFNEERESLGWGNYRIKNVVEEQNKSGKSVFTVELERIDNREAVLQGFSDDYSDLLIENNEFELPGSFYTPVQDAYVPMDEGDLQDVSDEFTDSPLSIARMWDSNDLTDAFIESVEDGTGKVLLEFPDGFQGQVDSEAVRDALQIQGIDTNEILENIELVGLLDDFDDADIDADIDAIDELGPEADLEDAEAVESNVDSALDAVINKYSTEYDIESFEQYGGQAGSNEGGFYEDLEGSQYYVKVPKSELHAQNEVLASALYELADVPAANQLIGSGDDGEKRVFSELVPGAKSDLGDKLGDEEYMKKLQEGFAIDAWLANWDVAGLMFDNVVTDENGDPVRVDPGGALMFRAMGAPKGDIFGNDVTELDTLVDPNKNERSAAVFGSMTEDEKVESARKLLDISDDDIDAIVDSIVTDGEAAQKLKDTLKARRFYILDRYGLLNEDTNQLVNDSQIDEPVVEEVTPEPAELPEPVENIEPEAPADAAENLYVTSDGTPITIGMKVRHKKTGEVGEVVKYDKGNTGYVHVKGPDGKIKNKSTNQLVADTGDGGGDGGPKAPEEPEAPEAPAAPEAPEPPQVEETPAPVETPKAAPAKPQPYDIKKVPSKDLKPGDLIGGGEVLSVYEDSKTPKGKINVVYKKKNGKIVKGTWWKSTNITTWKEGTLDSSPEAPQAPVDEPVVDVPAVPSQEGTGLEELTNPFPTPDLQKAADDIVKIFPDGIGPKAEFISLDESDGRVTFTLDGESVYMYLPVNGLVETSYPIDLAKQQAADNEAGWRELTQEELDYMIQEIQKVSGGATPQELPEPEQATAEDIDEPDVDGPEELAPPPGAATITNASGQQIWKGLEVADKNGNVGIVQSVNKDNYAQVVFADGSKAWRSGKTLTPTGEVKAGAISQSTAAPKAGKVTPAGAPVVIVDQPADWTTSDFSEIPSFVAAIDAVKSEDRRASGMAGASAAVDSDSIEDLDVRIMRVRDEDGNDGIRLKFKLTAWAGNAKAKELLALSKEELNASGGTRDSTVQLQKIDIGEDGIGQIVKGESGYQGSYNQGHTWTLRTDDGIVVRFHRGNTTATSALSQSSPKAFHNLVEIQAPANATPEQLAKAMNMAGVVDTRPATQGDARVLVENRLMSIFDAKTDATKNPKGAEREESLARIESKYGITADNVVLTTGASGRIETRLDEAGAQKIVDATGKPAAILHNVTVPYKFSDTKEEQLEKEANYIADLLATPQGGLLSTSTRWTEGIGGSGMSSHQDVTTGGADYVFTKPVLNADAKVYGTGSVVMYFDPVKVYQRIDFYANYSDKYGKRIANQNILGAAKTGAYEVMFKHRLSYDDLDSVIVRDQAMRTRIISMLRQRGIEEIGGRPLEAVILIGSNVKV